MSLLISSMTERSCWYLLWDWGSRAPEFPALLEADPLDGVTPEVEVVTVGVAWNKAIEDKFPLFEKKGPLIYLRNSVLRWGRSSCVVGRDFRRIRCGNWWSRLSGVMWCVLLGCQRCKSRCCLLLLLSRCCCIGQSSQHLKIGKIHVGNIHPQKDLSSRLPFFWFVVKWKRSAIEANKSFACGTAGTDIGRSYHFAENYHPSHFSLNIFNTKNLDKIF